MKTESGVVFVVFILFLLLPIAFSLSCEVKTSCEAGENKILGFSSFTNAHVELPFYANYSYSLCCKGARILTNGIGTFISISSKSNAHVARYGFYPINLSLVDEENKGYYSCALKDACENNELCVLSLSSEVNAHASDCEKYPYAYKVCCKYSSYIEINVTSGNVTFSGCGEFEVAAGEIVEVYIKVKNNYPQDIDVNFSLAQITFFNSSGSFVKNVKKEWKEKYIIEFCEINPNSRKCIEKAERNFTLVSKEEKIFKLLVLIPPESSILSKYILNFTLASKKLGKTYTPAVTFKVIGGKVKIKIDVVVTDAFGRRIPNREVKICICKPQVKLCYPENAFYVYPAVSDEQGRIYRVIRPVLELNATYKLSVVTERGYAEAIIKT